MSERPTSLIAIAIILIIMAVISFVINIIKLSNLKLSHSNFQLGLFVLILGTLFVLIVAIGIFLGWKKARLLFIFHGINVIMSSIVSPIKMMFIISTVLFLIICFFLFSDEADAYFSGRVYRSDSEKNNY